MTFLWAKICSHQPSRCITCLRYRSQAPRRPRTNHLREERTSRRRLILLASCATLRSTGSQVCAAGRTSRLCLNFAFQRKQNVSKWTLLGPTRKNAFQWKQNLRGPPSARLRASQKKGDPRGAARICAPLSRGEKRRRYASLAQRFLPAWTRVPAEKSSGSTL